MRTKIAMSSSSIPNSPKTDFSVIPTDFVFLRNPSPRLIKALGKTEADLEPDEWNRENLRWLNLPSVPEDVEIYYDGLESTCLLEELEEEAVVEVATANTVPFEIPKVSKKQTQFRRKVWRKFA